MAKNITLMGANYPDVPAVDLPKTGGGTARFYDINVVDNLNSTSATDALSANQGRVLNGRTTFGEWNTADGIRYRKSSRFVELNVLKVFSQGVTIASWSSYKIGAISGYSNDLDAYITCMVLSTGNNRVPTILTVKANGDIEIFNNSTSSLYVTDVYAYGIFVNNS